MEEKEQQEVETNETAQNTERSGSAVESSPTVQAQKTHRIPNRRMRVAAVVSTIGLVAGFFGGLLGSYVGGLLSPESSQTISKQVVLNEGQLISSIVKDVGASVVSVNVTRTTKQTDFFGRTFSSEGASAGTGIIVSKDGYVVTNRHVVDSGTTDVSVTLSDGTTLDEVDIVGRTTDGDSLDIAILKINDTKGITLSPASLGDSSKLQVGDKVVAIGNALGQFQNTVTSGIISGYGRSIEAGNETGTDTEVLQNLIQTDAAINSGNSGGPLVNMNSEVIGINTAVASGAAQNIGFAIPINDVTGLINGVIRTGKFERPYLGVRYVVLNDDYAYTYNLNVKRGAYLAPDQNGGAIVPGSPADKAGLKEKDVITKVNGIAIDENNSLSSLIGRNTVGDKVALTVVRDGSETTVTATLGSYE
ncbi:trypsin-like serine protease [Candidatus Saccharibacteria bacterium]|nr:trypsin-like serine protease [Candidatus Saccharibacteria bacterium]